MLVLSRKPNERIKIVTPDGTVIDLLVVRLVGQHKVQIGVSAPGDYAVHRDEVYKAIRRNSGDLYSKPQKPERRA